MGKPTFVRLEDDEKEQLEKLAKKQERSVSYLIRLAVREFLKRIK